MSTVGTGVRAWAREGVANAAGTRMAPSDLTSLGEFARLSATQTVLLTPYRFVQRANATRNHRFVVAPATPSPAPYPPPFSTSALCDLLLASARLNPPRQTPTNPFSPARRAMSEESARSKCARTVLRVLREWA